MSKYPWIFDCLKHPIAFSCAEIALRKYCLFSTLRFLPAYCVYNSQTCLLNSSVSSAIFSTAIIHYTCEYYCPGYGWIRADSRFSGAITPSPYNESIVLKVIYPEEENDAGSGVQGNGGLVPWVWMTNDNVIQGKTRGWCWTEGKISMIDIFS